MYKCDSCTQISERREKQNKFVIQKREKVYYKTETFLDEEGNTVVSNGVEQGRGFETVVEANLCNQCFGAVNV